MLKIPLLSKFNSEIFPLSRRDSISKFKIEGRFIKTNTATENMFINEVCEQWTFHQREIKFFNRRTRTLKVQMDKNTRKNTKKESVEASYRCPAKRYAQDRVSSDVISKPRVIRDVSTNGIYLVLQLQINFFKRTFFSWKMIKLLNHKNVLIKLIL